MKLQMKINSRMQSESNTAHSNSRRTENPITRVNMMILSRFLFTVRTN